jgi:putative molybdopterin biosynthesis protein
MVKDPLDAIPGNCLRQVRQEAGFSQSDLAARAGVARQTVGGIEAGQYGPSLAVAFRLARVLGKTVEDIFWFPDVPEEVPAAWSGLGPEPDAGEKIYLTSRGGNYAAFPVGRDGLQSEANALVRENRGREPLLATILDPESLQCPTVLLAGCSPALDIIKKRLNQRYRDVKLYWVNVNSMASLRALEKGIIHGAGLHIYDEETGEYNLPIIQRTLQKKPYVVVNLCYGEQGFVLPKGNPGGIASYGDLARPGVRVVNRELGAETRRLLDTGLKASHLTPEQVAGYNFQVKTHQEVVQAVALGGADCGISLRSLAQVYNLDFIPITHERYDLVFLQENLAEPGVQAILECLGKRSFHLELESSGLSPVDCGKELT